MDLDIEQDLVELDDIRFRMGTLGSLSAAIGGDDGEPMSEAEDHRDGHCRDSPAPAYNSLETGFRGGGRSPTTSFDQQSSRSVARGIRVDVEQATQER